MSKGLAYHEMMTVLGVGDLHPGGKLATDFLLGELDKAAPNTVLEVGAGGGQTTGRMMKRGWQVTAIEPNAVLCAKLRARSGLPAQQVSFEGLEDDGARYDAVIGEGVLYGLDPEKTVSKVHRLLRPGGLLAFVDMLWTDAAKSDVVAFVHDRTNEVFGIPMASREIITSAQWVAALRGGGFSEVATRTIEPAAWDDERRATRARLRRGLFTHPHLVPLFLKYRLYNLIVWAPPGWLESWMTVWRRS